MSTMDKQTNMTVEEAVLEHGCYNCGHVRLDKSCKVYCQLRVEGGRCVAYNSWTPLPEPCIDAVSRQTVKEQMIKYGFLAPDMTVTEFVEDELLPVTPKPKTGKWIEITTPRGTVIALRCSACEKSPKHAIRSDFCPNCGADMRGVSE